MSNTSTTYLVIAVAGVFSFAAWVWLIATPAWTGYSKVWERFLAMVMSVYVLAALLALGGGIAAVALYYYDQL
jgi:hypothetical protein